MVDMVFSVKEKGRRATTTSGPMAKGVILELTHVSVGIDPMRRVPRETLVEVVKFFLEWGHEEN